MAMIRQLRKTDSVHDLVELSRQFFEEYESHHDEFFKIDDLQDTDITGYFSSFLDADHRAAFVALEDETIIGYITVYIQSQPDYWKIKQVGTISGLMVHPDHRRKGIGHQLVMEARAFFEERGIQYFTVYTASANEAARAFYARTGMTPLHVTLIGTCRVVTPGANEAV